MAKRNEPPKYQDIHRKTKVKDIEYSNPKDPKIKKERKKIESERELFEKKKAKYEEAVAKHLPDHKWNRPSTKKKGIQIGDGLDIDYKKKGGKLKKKTEKELMKIVLKNLKASDKVKTMYKKEGGGINKLPKDSWKKGEDYYPPSSEMEEGGYGKKKKPSTKGVAPKSKKKGKKKLRVAPIPKKKPPMSFNQRVDKQLKKRMDEFTKKFFERKQYEEDKEGGWYLPHPDAPVLRNIKHGGKIKYRSIGGRLSGNDIIKKIYD
jgi:hypothetical protein